ncbi:hypothetical protein D3C79_786820 [compost metagenome]
MDGLGRDHVDSGNGTGQVRQVLVVLGNDVFGAEVAVVDRGVGVRRQHHVVAQFQCLAHGGVDAIIGLQPADDQALEVIDRQQLLQVGLVERIRGGLAYARILW